MTNTISALLAQSGINHWGYADVSQVVPQDLAHYKTAISFYVPLSRGIINQVVEAPTPQYFHLYRTVNREIDSLLLRLSIALEGKGYDSYMIAASQSLPDKDKPYQAIFQHRTAARLAGLGYIGKSGCLITPDHGPRVRLATLLTTYVPPSYASPLEEACGSCRVCASVCPAMAIYGVNWQPHLSRQDLLDARACSQHMHRAYQHIGRGVVCGLCFSHCPKGK